MNGAIENEDAVTSVASVTEIDGLSSLIEASVEKELATESVPFTANENQKLSNDTSSLLTPRPVKHRPTFTEEQITAMEAIFEHRQYLSPMERQSLANTVSLTPQQVRVWFQNRRQKMKSLMTQTTSPGSATVDVKVQVPNSKGLLVSDNVQQLTGQVDMQLLQLLLAKSLTQNGEDQPLVQTAMEPDTQQSKDDEAITISTAENSVTNGNQDASNKTPKASPPPATTSATLTPAQTLLCLTPFLLPLQIQTSSGPINLPPAIQLASTNPSPSSKANHISPAITTVTPSPSNGSIQVSSLTPTQLQSLISQSLQATPPPAITQLSNLIAGSTPSIVPLTAESPTTISSELGEPANEIEIKKEGTTVTAINTETLQQIIGGQNTSGDDLKTWSATSTPTLTPCRLTQIREGGVNPPRKKRQVFSGEQIIELEKRFQESQYVDNQDREKLAAKIGLTADQVKVWFQNRRTKKNRISWRQKPSSN